MMDMEERILNELKGLWIGRVYERMVGDRNERSCYTLVVDCDNGDTVSCIKTFTPGNHASTIVERKKDSLKSMQNKGMMVRLK